MAVDMAEIELAKGKRAPEKALARQIISSQKAEITQMQAWLKSWYGLTREQALARSPGKALIMRMDAQMQADMMTPLEQAARGNQTDLQFLRLMIPHHQMAVIESRAALPGTRHVALADMERSIIRAQSAEIRRMTAWLHAWFCHPARPHR